VWLGFRITEPEFNKLQALNEFLQTINFSKALLESPGQFFLFKWVVRTLISRPYSNTNKIKNPIFTQSIKFSLNFQKASQNLTLITIKKALKFNSIQ
jgi:hypothetical protein